MLEPEMIFFIPMRKTHRKSFDESSTPKRFWKTKKKILNFIQRYLLLIFLYFCSELKNRIDYGKTN